MQLPFAEIIRKTLVDFSISWRYTETIQSLVLISTDKNCHKNGLHIAHKGLCDLYTDKFCLDKLMTIHYFVTHRKIIKPFMVYM